MITVYKPNQNKVVWGTVTKDGKSSNIQLENIISQIQRNKAKPQALEIECLYNNKHYKLGTLFRPSTRRDQIDWPKQKTLINKLLNKGYTLEEIAKEIGVLKSTLSMANQKHKLYYPRTGAQVTAERAKKSCLGVNTRTLQSSLDQSNSNSARAFNESV